MTKKTNSGAANSNTVSTEKKTPQISAVETAKATPAKPLESDFDLLSLSQQSTQQTVTTKTAIANDLLCLGGTYKCVSLVHNFGGQNHMDF